MKVTHCSLVLESVVSSSCKWMEEIDFENDLDGLITDSSGAGRYSTRWFEL